MEINLKSTEIIAEIVLITFDKYVLTIYNGFDKNGFGN